MRKKMEMAVEKMARNTKTGLENLYITTCGLQNKEIKYLKEIKTIWTIAVPTTMFYLWKILNGNTTAYYITITSLCCLLLTLLLIYGRTRANETEIKKTHTETEDTE